MVFVLSAWVFIPCHEFGPRRWKKNTSRPKFRQTSSAKRKSLSDSLFVLHFLITKPMGMRRYLEHCYPFFYWQSTLDVVLHFTRPQKQGEDGWMSTAQDELHLVLIVFHHLLPKIHHCILANQVLTIQCIVI